MTAVTTLYGSFDENQLKSIRDALNEISNEMVVIDSHKEAIKDVINALYDNFKIPKKVIGPNAKAIITGDPTQIDLPKNQQSGLFKATRVLRNIDGISYIELDEEDVVRHRLVKAIIKAYQKDDDKQEKEKQFPYSK